VDLLGGEIPNGVIDGVGEGTAGYDACAKACLARGSTCTFFTVFSGSCYLKGTDDGAAPRDGAVSGACERGRWRTVRTTLRVDNPLPWTAETPHLYTTVARLKSLHVGGGGSEGTRTVLVEAMSIVTGFRTVAMIDGLLTVNGRPIVIRGVNRHEHNLTTCVTRPLTCPPPPHRPTHTPTRSPTRTHARHSTHSTRYVISGTHSFMQPRRHKHTHMHPRKR
jgi:hypothetical protein